MSVVIEIKFCFFPLFAVLQLLSVRSKRFPCRNSCNERRTDVSFETEPESRSVERDAPQVSGIPEANGSAAFAQENEHTHPLGLRD